MVATTTANNSLLNQLKKDFPEVTFRAGDCFLWSPKERVVQYCETSDNLEQRQWSLLHEVSHYILGHQSYHSDFELLQLELAAWEQAKKLGKQYHILINQNHIEDCLDTYRDWLHKRSLCPTCGVTGVQSSEQSYNCPNCPAVWHVSMERFCRAYRRKIQ